MGGTLNSSFEIFGVPFMGKTIEKGKIMNVRIRNIAGAIAIAAGVAGLVSCGNSYCDPAKHIVNYSVTSDSGIANLAYTVYEEARVATEDFEDSEETTPPSEWSRQLLGNDEVTHLVLTGSSYYGKDLTCKIVVDGKTVSEKKGKNPLCEYVNPSIKKTPAKS